MRVMIAGAVALMGMAGAASAAAVVPAGPSVLQVDAAGAATGITNIVAADGTVYDLDFTDPRSCAEIYSGCDSYLDFPRLSGVSVDRIADAISSALTSAGLGASGLAGSSLLVPTTLRAGGFVSGASIDALSGEVTFGAFQFSATEAPPLGERLLRFDDAGVAPAPVPLPASVLLLGLGMGALSIFKRRA